MNTTDSDYALEPTAFHSMEEAQQLTDTLEEIIHDQRMGAANVRPELVEIFSEIVNNGAEHGMSEARAHTLTSASCHNRKSVAFDAVIVDSGPGIRPALWPCNHTANPAGNRTRRLSALAVQEFVSAHRRCSTWGNGLWKVATEMGKSGRKLLIHLSSGLLIKYGTAEPEVRDIEDRRATLVRMTIPARAEGGWV